MKVVVICEERIICPIFESLYIVSLRVKEDQVPQLKKYR